MITINVSLSNIAANGAKEIAIPYVWQGIAPTTASFNVFNGATSELIGSFETPMPINSVGFLCLDLRFVNGAVNARAVWVPR